MPSARADYETHQWGKEAPNVTPMLLPLAQKLERWKGLFWKRLQGLQPQFQKLRVKNLQKALSSLWLDQKLMDFDHGWGFFGSPNAPSRAVRLCRVARAWPEWISEGEGHRMSPSFLGCWTGLSTTQFGDVWSVSYFKTGLAHAGTPLVVYNIVQRDWCNSWVWM